MFSQFEKQRLFENVRQKIWCCHFLHAARSKRLHRFWTDKAFQMRGELVHDHKNKPSCQNSTPSNTRWRGWLNTFTDIFTGASTASWVQVSSCRDNSVSPNRKHQQLCCSVASNFFSGFLSGHAQVICQQLPLSHLSVCVSSDLSQSCGTIRLIFWTFFWDVKLLPLQKTSSTMPQTISKTPFSFPQKPFRIKHL